MQAARDGKLACKAETNVVNFFDNWLFASRDGKWKWIYLTFVPAKTSNVGIRILIWILNGCIRFVFSIFTYLVPYPYSIKIWNIRYLSVSTKNKV